MALDAVLFDFDGTIAPTSIRQEAWLKFYSQIHGKEWPFATFDTFLSFYNQQCSRQGGVQNVYDELGLPCDMNDKKHPVWPAYERFNQDNPQDLYPGMKETVEEIWKLGGLSKDPGRNSRLRLGINTANSWRSIFRDLDKGGILPYFDCFIAEEILSRYHGAGNQNAIKKPSPISLNLSLEMLGSSGARVLHIGDTLNDLHASHKVLRFNPLREENLVTVGACYGYEGREKLGAGVQTAEGAVKFDYLIDTPKELVGIVKELLSK
ncbi:MAG: HAD family hydrolase [Nanoarchaeota archaeon]